MSSLETAFHQREPASTALASAAPSHETLKQPYSFVLHTLRPNVMKMHPTKRLAPFASNLNAFFQFLTDSYYVFQALETCIQETPELNLLLNSGLERAPGLLKDIQWMQTNYPDSAPTPYTVGPAGKAYAELLETTSKTSIPIFICHLYNIYFAHNAGGRMIGRQATKKLFEGTTLNFYEPIEKSVYTSVIGKIDKIAEGWTAEQMEESLRGIYDSFAYGRRLLEIIYPVKALNAMY